MFFFVGKEIKQNFSNFYTLGPFTVSTDAGWQEYSNDTYCCIYKGYVDSAPLEQSLDQIAEQAEPELPGNFCVILYNHCTKLLHIKSDRLRSFPLYYKNSVGIGNLHQMEKTVWANGVISANVDLVINYNKFNLIGKLEQSLVSCEELIEFVDQRLSEKTENFLKHNRLPIKVFLSGGVDTALVFSYLQKYTKKYELVKCNIVEYDRFWLQNSTDITKENWAYTQIHHWTSPALLTSGAPGDEFTLRNPLYANLYLKFFGESIPDLLKQRTWFHSAYFGQPEYIESYQTQTIDNFATLQQLQWELCNSAANDWQHWHLGNTLTWTPLRDLEIFKMFLRLPVKVAIDQIMNSAISLKLIEKNYPKLLSAISEQKNSENYQKNLANFLFESDQ